MSHDPLCGMTQVKIGNTLASACSCDLIALVRADERARANQTIPITARGSSQTTTRGGSGWTNNVRILP